MVIGYSQGYKINMLTRAIVRWWLTSHSVQCIGCIGCIGWGNGTRVRRATGE